MNTRETLIQRVANDVLIPGGSLGTRIVTRSGATRHVSVGTHVSATAGPVGYEVIVTGPPPRYDLQTDDAARAARRFVWFVGPSVAQQALDTASA